jgi:phosphoribosylaminoimidazole carboxylase PurE protein
MGSPADAAHGDAIAAAARDLGLEVEQRVGSAHRTPTHVLDILRHYEADPRPKVYITVAGRSNALSGFTDPQVSAPVIACPPPSDSYGGADVWSSLRMPAGVAPAVVLDPANAALLAAKILGLGDPAVREKIGATQRRAAERVLAADADGRRDAVGAHNG